MDRIIKLTPAYDKRPKYGVHGVNLAMYLVGPEGAIQFILYTNWQLPHVTVEWERQGSHGLDKPLPADLGYHSKVPRYDGQEPMDEDCEWTGGRCYYDGSGLNANPVFDVLLREGDEGVWRLLEAEYQLRLGEVKSGK